VEEPEAVAADDNRPSGVYKGVTTTDNESGTVKAVIATDESTGTAQVTLGSAVYTATQFGIDEDGQGNTVYTFSGPGFTLVIVATPGGDLVGVDLDIDGEDDLDVDLAKEHSDQLVKCFEGTWSGQVDGTPWSGTWNFIVVDTYIQGSYKGDDDGSYDGAISGSSATIDLGSGSANGTFSGDCASGGWQIYSYAGFWSGCRTL